jgi:hypothetical protein
MDPVKLWHSNRIRIHNTSPVVPLMDKRLTQAGVWIRFDYALSDPALCIKLCLRGDKDTRVYSCTTTQK